VPHLTARIETPEIAMSGLEVVGVVLGALPLAVKALQGYMSVLSSMKHAQRNLNALIRDLETEQIRLQTTCELLLDGVAPPSVIDKLIQTPFGPDWKPYNDRLRLRLWTTSGKFEEQVLELQQAAQELRAKLCLEPDGTVCFSNRHEPGRPRLTLIITDKTNRSAFYQPGIEAWHVFYAEKKGLRRNSNQDKGGQLGPSRTRGTELQP
jgi:hypothetical protein